jgi:flagellar biosynthetic protein FliP
MKYLLGLILLMLIPEAQAQGVGIPAISIDGGNGDGQTYTVTLEILALMTMLTLLPAILLMMTSFTRIIIVLSILRQALGTAQTPSNQIILGLALFLTLFVMSPVFDQVYLVAMQPYLNGSLSAMDALQAATEPFKTFMLAQTRETDIRMFADIAGVTEIESPEKTPFTLLMPAFVTSELKTAFQIGFLVFIPFVVIDLVVASVLMSMGMMMLSPMIISLPFKLMLFVLVDGWALIMGTLASSFLLGA